MLVVELFRNHSLFLWLSIGAASSGILALLGIPISGQIVVFANISGILILLERRFSERYAFKQSGNAPIADAGLQPVGPEKVASADAKELNIFRKSGDVWEIQYAGTSFIAKHSIGLVHMRSLIIKAGEWVHCSELKRISSERLGDAKHAPYSRMNDEQMELESLRIGAKLQPEKIIDRLSLDKIRKLREVLLERKESDDFDSPEERIDQLNTLEFIERYLRSATDKNGQPRKLFDQEETDRKAVSVAINRCRNNLCGHEALFIHLKSFIQAEGNSFRYLPDRPINWKVD
jgi:membrane protein implicated in regulation of membrane protease activity